MPFTKNPTNKTYKKRTLKDGTVKVYVYEWRKHKSVVPEREKYVCACGCSVSFYHKQRHMRTKKHKKLMAKIEEENKKKSIEI